MLNFRRIESEFQTYSGKVFKTVDDEILPEVGLLRLNIEDQRLWMIFGEHERIFDTGHETIDILYEKKHELDAFVRMLPDYDQEWHHAVATSYVRKDAYLFACILIFDRRMLSPYDRLPLKAASKHRSIIESIILELVSVLDSGLKAYATEEPFNPPSVNALLRSAGKSMFTSLLDAQHRTNPFENISKISSLSYEKTFSDGKILLVDSEDLAKLQGDGAFDVLIRFETRIPLTQLRHIRKILELSGQNIYLLSDGEYIYGTVQIYDFDGAMRQLGRLLTIEFNQFSSWQLSYNLGKLFQITHEELIIPKPKISYFKFSHALRELYAEFDSKRTLQLYKLILEAFKQVKGTLIVISKNARSESMRLKNQGFVIQPRILTEESMRSITQIDGAVLMDLDGVCHGIGVILDGIATEKGDPSRGARYNSAIRYVETISNNPNFADVLVVVISEDGDADIITKHILKLM